MCGIGRVISLLLAGRYVQGSLHLENVVEFHYKTVKFLLELENDKSNGCVSLG